MPTAPAPTVLLGLLAAATLVPALSQAENLADVFQLALQRDPQYAAALAGQQADQEALPQARARLLPHLTAQAGAKTNDIRRAAGLKRERTDREASWNLTLSQPIIDVSSWSELKQSQFVVQSADLAAKQAYQNLILRVSQAYFDVLTVQDTLQALDAQKSAAQLQLDRAERSYELGGATITDVYETRARLERIQASEIQANTQLQSAKDQLEKITGQSITTLAPLRDNVRLPAPSPAKLGDWTNQAAHANFNALQAELATRIAEKQIDIAKSGHYPRLDLYAQTGSASNRGVYGPGTQPRALDSNIGLQLSIPIYSGGGVSSRVREQTSRLQQSRYDYEAAKRLAVQETQLHFAGVTSGLSQISVLKSAEQASQQSVQANQTAYELGARDNTQVLDALQQLYETRRDLAHAHYHTLMSGLYLKASSGALSEDDLLDINQLLKP